MELCEVGPDAVRAMRVGDMLHHLHLHIVERPVRGKVRDLAPVDIQEDCGDQHDDPDNAGDEQDNFFHRVTTP